MGFILDFVAIIMVARDRASTKKVINDFVRKAPDQDPEHANRCGPCLYCVTNTMIMIQ